VQKHFKTIALDQRLVRNVGNRNSDRPLLTINYYNRFGLSFGFG